MERGPDSQFRFKSGIQFDAKSQSVSVNPDNIDAVAKCFFDTDRGQRSYNARYAAGAISAFARADIARRIENSWEPHGRIEIDLAALGVTLEDLRKQPLHFGSHPPGPFEFTDTSNGQKKIVSLMHNGGREPGAPEVGIAAEAAQPAAIPLLSDPAHPAHDLYAQTLRAFAASPQIAAAGYSEERQQLLAANLVAGNLKVRESRNGPPLQERIDRVDAATIASDGSHVTIIQRAAQDATSFRFGLPMEQAHSGSIEAASKMPFDGLQQQKAQELAQQAERARAPQPEPEGPSR